jgi:Na+-driven multidrug efflux pump
VYFLMTAWAWPFSFASFALSGFAMGLNNFEALSVIGSLSNLAYLLGIEVLFANDPRLEVLGYVRFLGTAMPALLWTLYFLSRRDLRVKLGLARQADQDQILTSHAGPRGAMHEFWSDPETKLAMRDGALAMLVELTVELGRTITLYVAAKTIGIGGFYQISAHMAIQMETGLAFASGALINMKLQGPQLLGAGLHDHFLWLVEYVYVFGLLAFFASTLVVYTGHMYFVVDKGDRISLFASNEACLSDYSAFFGTPSSSIFSEASFVSTILSVPVIVFIRIVYQVAKSALYAMQDFLFMVQASLAAFFVVFLPAVLIMGFTSQSALVSVMVMSLPNLICGIAFTIRLKSHTDRLDSEEGHKHNMRLQRTNTALGSYGIDPVAREPRKIEAELSWGSTSDADRITGGPADALGVMPPPS